MNDDSTGGIYPYDLTSTKPLIPQVTPFRMTREEAIRARRDASADDRRLEREVADATAEWRTTHHALAGNPVADAVLFLHQPQKASSKVTCSECMADNGAYEADSAPWPCATYTAVVEAGL